MKFDYILNVLLESGKIGGSRKEVMRADTFGVAAGTEGEGPQRERALSTIHKAARSVVHAYNAQLKTDTYGNDLMFHIGKELKSAGLVHPNISVEGVKTTVRRYFRTPDAFNSDHLNMIDNHHSNARDVYKGLTSPKGTPEFNNATKRYNEEKRKQNPYIFAISDVKSPQTEAQKHYDHLTDVPPSKQFEHVRTALGLE